MWGEAVKHIPFFQDKQLVDNCSSADCCLSAHSQDCTVLPKTVTYLVSYVARQLFSFLINGSPLILESQRSNLRYKSKSVFGLRK